MDKFYIELYPKADLENEWAKNKHTPGAMPCMRCGGPMRESLAENALSRALNVYVCPACGIDEALRDAAGKVLPISEWYAVKQRRFAEHKDPQAVKLMPACAFMEIFSGAQKTLPLSGARYPASLVAYSRSDYDGWRWWTTWFPDEEMLPCSGAWSGNRRLPVTAARPAGIQNPVGDGANVPAVCPTDK